MVQKVFRCKLSGKFENFSLFWNMFYSGRWVRSSSSKSWCWCANKSRSKGKVLHFLSEKWVIFALILTFLMPWWRNNWRKSPKLGDRDLQQLEQRQNRQLVRPNRRRQFQKQNRQQSQLRLDRQAPPLRHREMEKRENKFKNSTKN